MISLDGGHLAIEQVVSVAAGLEAAAPRR